MKRRVIFVERKPSGSPSIERLFRQVEKDLPPDQFDIEFQQVPYGNSVLDVFKNLLFFRPRPADLYHLTGHIYYISLILPKRKTVLTIHDLIFLHRRTGPRRFILKKLFLDWPLRRVRRITVVSNAIKDEIVELTSIDCGRITVIKNPLIDRFIAGDIKPFDKVCPVILQIGTAENKNIDNLIKAVVGLNCKLRIIGRLDDKIVQSLERHGTLFENAFGLNDEQIIEEYRNADIVSFCSTYEGFGLPIIEAQALLTPVITSDIAPMNYVAGNGALLVDPHDVASIKNGLLRLINDPEYRNMLIEEGSKNVVRFDGKVIAAQYADVYERVLDRSDQT